MFTRRSNNEAGQKLQAYAVILDASISEFGELPDDMGVSIDVYKTRELAEEFLEAEFPDDQDDQVKMEQRQKTYIKKIIIEL